LERRAIYPKKRGFIGRSTPKLIETLGISQDDWIEVIKNFSRHYGSLQGVKKVCVAALINTTIAGIRGLADPEKRLINSYQLTNDYCCWLLAPNLKKTYTFSIQLTTAEKTLKTNAVFNIKI